MRAILGVLLLLPGLCAAHDVFIGSTTLDCRSDHHSCETSGTVMLGPGETFNMTTHVAHDVEYVSIGYLEAEKDKNGVVPTLQNVANLSVVAVDTVQCDLEFFSVVWFCPTHKDIVLARNGTYVLHVPASAQQSQFIAWGRSESPELVLGLTVQQDAARARHKAGGMLPGVALGVGSGVTLVLLVAMAWCYRNSKYKSQTKTVIVHVVALVSHVWYVTVPLARAVDKSPQDIAYETREPIFMYFMLDGYSVLGVLVWSWRTMEETVSNDTLSADGWKPFDALAIITVVAAYVLTAVLHGVTAWSYAFVVIYGLVLVAFNVYIARVGVTVRHELKSLLQWQCAALAVFSLLSIANSAHRMFFILSAIQWALLVAVLQVLAVLSGAITVENVPPGVLWSAVFVSTWAVLFFDVTSYGVAGLMLLWSFRSTACLSKLRSLVCCTGT